MIVSQYLDAKVLKPTIAAVIPCFNTETTIAEIVSSAQKYVDQVIVVDDNSKDGTNQKARKAGAWVISHKKNQGKGTALKTAIQSTDADIVVTLDGDGQHNPDDIPRLVSPILKGEADLVLGSRHLRHSKIDSASLTRRVANIIASAIMSAIVSIFLPLSQMFNRIVHLDAPHQYDGNKASHKSKKWFTDCTSGFRAIKKQKWQELEISSKGFEIEAEVIYEAVKNRLVITEVPISCHWNGHGSNLSIIRDGFKTFVLLERKLLSDMTRRRNGHLVHENQLAQRRLYRVS